MEKFVTWVIDNAPWLFSGLGIVIVGWLVRLIFNKTAASSTQIIRSGDSSKNIQAGRDVSVGMEKKRSDVDER